MKKERATMTDRPTATRPSLLLGGLTLLLMVVAAIVPARAASSYEDLLAQAQSAYGDASNGFHPEVTMRRIDDQLASFNKPFADLAIVIERERAGRYHSDNIFRTASSGELGVIEGQYKALEVAVATAAQADAAKVKHAPVDRAAAARKAADQEKADKALLARVGAIIEQARSDIAAAGAK